MSTQIGLFYGTDTGNTEICAGKIKDKLNELLGREDVDVIEIYQKNREDMAKYEYLVIGQPTWYDGELQGDWEEFMPEFQEIDFSGKKVAFFGLGDQYGYAAYFCDSIGIFADIAEAKGAKLCGFTTTDGYEHDYSKAERDGQFVGLCIDMDNQDELTDERIDKWVPQIIEEFGLGA